MTQFKMDTGWLNHKYETEATDHCNKGFLGTKDLSE